MSIMKKDSIFHTEAAEGIFQLSSARDGLSREVGKASGNSYLVTGESSAVLIDLALKEKELYSYACALAGKPVMTVLTHAHVDHIYNIESLKEVTVHPGDEELLRDGARFQRPVRRCPVLHYVRGGDTIDLGGRILDVIHIPGHTDGSIMLYDRRTGILLSGDTVTRRLLYGMHTFVPLEEFCESLKALKNFEISRVYSCHDRCALPASQAEHMSELIRKKDTLEHKEQRLPMAGKFVTYTNSTEDKLDYLSMAVMIR